LRSEADLIQATMALIQDGRRSIALPVERQTMNALFIGIALRVEPDIGVPMLDKIPLPLRKMALLHAAHGGRPPSPALAEYTRAFVLASGEALGDDEAALGLWAGLAPSDVGFGEVPAAARTYDTHNIASRMLTWGVPADSGAARRWIAQHLDGLAADAAKGTLVSTRTDLPAADATELVSEIATPRIRLDALVQVAARADQVTAAAFGPRWQTLATTTLDALGEPDASHLAMAAATVGASAPSAAKAWLDAASNAIAKLPLDKRPVPLRWVALACARLGFARWSTLVDATFADRTLFGLKDNREILAVDVIGVVDRVSDLDTQLDAAQNVIREQLRRLKTPLWRAVVLSLLLPMIAKTPGRHPGSVGLELATELKRVSAERDIAGRYLPALLDRAFDADAALAFELCRQVSDPTLRTFGAIHLYELLRRKVAATA
jgi:hypothetical protein